MPIASADLVTCPPRAPAYGFPPTEMAWMEPEVPYWMRLPQGAKFTPTDATDAITVKLPGAKWFRSFAGGHDDGTFGVYDTISGAYYGCTYADTVNVIDAYQIPIGRIERAVPALPANIVFKTGHGLRFGSTPDDVKRVYGEAPLLPYPIEHLSYEKDVKDGSTMIATQTSFFFWQGHLVGVERSHGV